METSPLETSSRGAPARAGARAPAPRAPGRGSVPAIVHAVIVVGAGPACLAVAACLARRSVAATVLEQASAVAASWRRDQTGKASCACSRSSSASAELARAVRRGAREEARVVRGLARARGLRRLVLPGVGGRAAPPTAPRKEL